MTTLDISSVYEMARKFSLTPSASEYHSYIVTSDKKRSRLALVCPEQHGLFAHQWQLPFDLSPSQTTQVGQLQSIDGLPISEVKVHDSSARHLPEAKWVSAEDAIAAWQAGELIVEAHTLQVLRFLASGRELTTPSVWPLVPGVCLLPGKTRTLPPATHTNTYLLSVGRHQYIVDPAPDDPWEQERMASAIDVWRDGHPITALVLTHHHHDHSAGANWFQKRFSAPIVASKHAQDRLPFTVEAIGETLGDGDIDVLHTPGHAADHICLHHKRNSWLVAGDMVAGLGTILVEPNGGDMAQYIGSLTMLAGLSPRVLLPSHGPMIAGGEQKLRDYIEHRLWREAKILHSAQATGAASVGDLVKLAYDDVPLAVHPIAELSLQAHLNKLVADGALTDADGRYHVPANYDN